MRRWVGRQSQALRYSSTGEEANMTKLQCYGENSFTFLLFQALVEQDAVERVFVGNLKSFATGRKGRWTAATGEPEVWLFPNFGKRYGFGEPDVIVLRKPSCFFIEVETAVRNKSQADSALEQLLRFRCLARALSRGSQANRARGRLEVRGSTIGSKGGASRNATLVRRGHPVLRASGAAIRAACEAEQDHYVLLTDEKPKLGKSFATGIEGRLDALKKVHGIEVEASHFWYAYWEGDLNRKKNGFANPLGERYSRISSRAR